MDDLAFFGIDVNLPEETPELDVYQENWPAVMLFCSLSTQWNIIAMGGYSGLNYPALKIVLDMTPDIKDSYQVFLDIQVMERAALKVLNAKQDKQYE